MKQKEIIWKEISILNCSANAYPSGKPYKKQMLQGKVFPTTKEQAIAFVSMGCLLGILNSEDVKVVEKVQQARLEGRIQICMLQAIC